MTIRDLWVFGALARDARNPDGSRLAKSTRESWVWVDR